MLRISETFTQSVCLVCKKTKKSKSQFMARMNITLPAMGEGVIEATINKWLVKEGSVVKEDDPLVEVATDKVDSEIPAPAAGTLVSIICLLYTSDAADEEDSVDLG